MLCPVRVAWLWLFVFFTTLKSASTQCIYLVITYICIHIFYYLVMEGEHTSGHGMLHLENYYKCHQQHRTFEHLPQRCPQLQHGLRTCVGSAPVLPVIEEIGHGEFHTFYELIQSYNVNLLAY